MSISPNDRFVYTTVATALAELELSGRLIRAARKAFYVYQQQRKEHIQRGLVALTTVQDYDQNIILRHERTRPEKEQDRTKLTDMFSANTVPVFLTYQAEPAIDQLVDRATCDSSLFDVTTEDQARHIVGEVRNRDNTEFVRLFQHSVHVAYIANGHHLTACAANVARKRVKRHQDQSVDSEWFLSVLFPYAQLKILAYNRLARAQNGMDTVSFLRKLTAIGTIRPQTARFSCTSGMVGMSPYFPRPMCLKPEVLRKIWAPLVFTIRAATHLGHNRP